MHPKKERQLNKSGKNADNQKEAHVRRNLFAAKGFKADVILEALIQEEECSQKNTGKERNNDEFEPMDAEE